VALDYKRPAQQLEEELTFARGEIETERDPDYVDQLRGVAAAIEWALGREPVSPASFKVQPSPDWRGQLVEAVWAQEIESGVRVMPDGMNKHYARGMASALHWTAGDTEDTPA